MSHAPSPPDGADIRPDETRRDRLNRIERLPVPNEKRDGEPLYVHI